MIMNKIKFPLVVCFFLLFSSGIQTTAIAAEQTYSSTFIHEFEFDGALLRDVIRALSEQTGKNIIATQEASQIEVSIYLKNIQLKDAIEAICRINDLWYRQDGDSGTYRIMTTEEFQRDITVYKNDRVRVFRLLNPNVRIVAQAIEDLFGPRVELSLGLDPAQEQEFVTSSGLGGFGGSAGGGTSLSGGTNRGGSRSSSNSRSSSRVSTTGGGGGASIREPGTEIQDELTVDQIAALSASRVSSENLQNITSQFAPIYVTVNNEHNLIAVRTSDRDVMKEIASLIDQMDKPVPQVLLEMKVLDVLIDDDFRSLANVTTNVGQSDVADTANAGSFFPTNSFLFGNFPLEGGSFIYQFISNRVRATLELLIQNNRINVLSKPVILASNNRPAQLFVGQETILTTGVSSDVIVNQTNTSTFIQPETETRQVGNSITITPFINADDSITLSLQQETSSVNENGGTVLVQNGAGGVSEVAIDTVNTAALAGTVMAKHGYTMAVGGLIRNTKSNNVSKVPVLGDIPIVGTLFRRETQGDEHRELVLLVTPYVMHKGTDYENVTREKLLNDSRYEEWNQTKEVPPSFIKPKQEVPAKIEEELQIYENNTIKPAPVEKSWKLDAANDSSITVLTVDEKNASDYYADKQKNILELIEAAAKDLPLRNVIRVPLINNIPKPLFSSNFDLIAKPLYTWKQANLYLTKVEIKNMGKSNATIRPQDLRGNWLSASFDVETLLPNTVTYGYLISENEHIAGAAR